MAFEGWALSGAFRVQESEKVALTDFGLPTLEHPSLTAERVRELLDTLRRARRALFGAPLTRVVSAIDQAARRFLDPGDSIRTEALETIGSHGGFSGPMAREILNRMARDWTRPPLEALLHSEFGKPEVLDDFRPSNSGGEIRASGYPLSFHLGAGTVPGVATTSLIRALLVKSAVLLKPGRGDVPLSVLFGRGFQDVDPELGQSVAVVYWPGAQGPETEEALRGADLVVVYGGDATVDWVRGRMPATAHLVAYRHRLGVGLVGRDALGPGGGHGLLPDSPGRVQNARKTAFSAARAVTLFDQRGCVSPHVFFVEEGGETNPENWAEFLSLALDGLEEDLPSGPLSPTDGAVLQQLRGKAEMEESLGRGRVFHGGAEAPWTVLYHPDGDVVPSCLNRTVRVIPVAHLLDALPLLKPWAPHLQTVGAAGLGDSRKGILDGLVEMGVARIADLDGVPWPPPWWHHDGSGPLLSLVRWTDLEEG